MAIEWDDLRVFQTAVRAGDYSNAGRKLAMDRTTVGRRFARLERATGRTLWEQAAGGYRPTAAGQAVLRAADVMERSMSRLARDLAAAGGAPAAVAGPVRIAGTAGLGSLLLPALGDFLDRHPGISIELVGARDAIAAVHQRQADIGFAIVRAKPRDLAGERIAAFVQKRYVRASEVTGEGAAGSDFRAIGWGHAMMLANPQPWARLNQLGPAGAGIEVDGLAALRDAVRAGLGAAWLWSALGDRDPALITLADRAPAAAAADLWVVHRSELALEPAVAALRADAATIVAHMLAAPLLDAAPLA